MRPRILVDLSRQKFGRLTPIRETNIIKHRTICWLCICDCGTESIVRRDSLQGGQTKSCGCSHKDHPIWKKHGMYESKIFKIWTSMKQRCLNPKDQSYKNYGGRGINVCERWKNSFENFYSDMGSRPDGMSLDRIDNEKGYSSENCRWATRAQQRKNSRPSTGIHAQKTFVAKNISTGALIVSNNQNKFARDHGLHQSAISKCLFGSFKQHKGWEFVHGNDMAEVLS